MADLLRSLILPRTSNESFHSTKSSQSLTPSTPPQESSPDPESSTFPTAAVSISDVETYLNDPANQAVLSAHAKNNPANPTNPSPSVPGMSTPTASTSPVQLGFRSSHHVVTLYHLCQERGLTPEFDIEGDNEGGFGGWLKVGNETIGQDQRWRSKKDAKEGLSERGVEVVKGMEVRERGSAGRAAQKNWIGMLQDFYQSTMTTFGGPAYTEYALGLNFACTCQIPSSLPNTLSQTPSSPPTTPSQSSQTTRTFGSATTPFPNKKAARANAAMEAVQYLIEQGLVNEDGSVKAKKKGKGAGKAVRLMEKGLEVERDSTFAQRVNDLSPLLSLPAPFYQLTASSPSTPNLFSGAAYFSNSSLIPGPVGEVRNVYGRKFAKEECARAVWDVLRKMARERGVEVGIVEEGKGAEEG